MRLLIVTQAIDRDDPVLGFFHRWVEEFAKHFEHIHVICLKEGAHQLPAHVTVHSLGKERRASSSQLSAFRKIQYAFRFYGLIWSLRKEYDTVLVHMNQEYVLLGGKFWWLLQKPVYLWRNHYAGSFMTDLAAIFCRKVFCTSKFSYTAKYRKTVLMPVGVDTTIFKPLGVARKPNSVLSLARIAPSKRLEVLLEALRILKGKGTMPEAEIVGTPLPKDVGYRDALQKRIEDSDLTVRMTAGMRNDETPKIYSAYDIFVNCSGSGMYDKTIFEAAACGCLVLASSKDFAALVPKDFSFQIGNADELADRLEKLISLSSNEREQARTKMRSLAESHSLQELGRRLTAEIA